MADYDYWTELNVKLDDFYMQYYVVPEILSGAIFMKELLPFFHFSYNGNYTTFCVPLFLLMQVY